MLEFQKVFFERPNDIVKHQQQGILLDHGCPDFQPLSLTSHLVPKHFQPANGEPPGLNRITNLSSKNPKTVEFIGDSQISSQMGRSGILCEGGGLNLWIIFEQRRHR
eukprot:CAMPEP_0114549718 /NCGR_PEP_ID=MMETSP0114-20121206/5675_1 /TAXON_ID=31324 /ORGANISM="Goniomonas sp, Strain m" /LENGTH=106 /DNA_ID=CAMNT_0001734415 /DNA_START=118 /DNA_END=438 /DNA_ORIENTATION=-